MLAEAGLRCAPPDHCRTRCNAQVQETTPGASRLRYRTPTATGSA